MNKNNDKWKLRQKQSLPLKLKETMSLNRIREFYNHNHGNVYVSFSGGKDSTVLLHLVRRIFPNVEAVFIDTGLEYPEIKDFVSRTKNVTTIFPKENFSLVIKKYGYPVISKKVARQIRDLQNPTENNKTVRRLYLTGIKRDGTKTKFFKLPQKYVRLIDSPFRISEKCCDILKKNPIKDYEKVSRKHSFIGTMSSDSLQRESAYLKTGCNNYTRNVSMPLSFWLEKDIWNYIRKYKLDYSSIYDTGITRTGCMYCMFGVHLEKGNNRFQLMKITHPKIYDYCINKLELCKVLDFIGVKYD